MMLGVTSMRERDSGRASLALLVAALAAVAMTAPQNKAQDSVNWTQLRTVRQAPSPRWEHGLAYDSGRGRMVLFGGSVGNKAWLGDTWELVGPVWLRRTPKNSPSKRSHFKMVYDEARKRVVLFGGWFGSKQLSDTWEWDGNNWQQRFPKTSPCARHVHSMTYDAKRKRVLLFGGQCGFYGHVNDLWEWNGNNWTEHKNLSPRPSPRSLGYFEYDPRREVTLLYGGKGPGRSHPTDMWEWNGVRWKQLSPSRTPGPRGGQMRYDPSRDRMVLFGGWTPTGLVNDTWEWDGSNWLKRSPAAAPSVRWNWMCEYHPGYRRMVLFGSAKTSDIWTYGANQPARFEPFGSGCRGSAGIPNLAAARNEFPWLGQTFHVDLSSLPQNAPAFVLFGLSSKTIGPIPLPLDLRVLAMPGCTLYQSADLSVGLVNNKGTARISIPVPMVPQLASASFYAQGLVLDRPANAAGMTVSNAARLLLGAK